jgi:sec-independent protein translocase protein TatA
MRNIQWPELLLIALVVVLLFGARKLPETAKGLGQALRIFKREVKEEPPASTEAPKQIPPAQSQSTGVTQPPQSTGVTPPAQSPASPAAQPVPESEHTER